MRQVPWQKAQQTDDVIFRKEEKKMSERNKKKNQSKTCTWSQSKTCMWKQLDRSPKSSVMCKKDRAKDGILGL
ncbi:hypothetical protein VULLAG_LOCUS9747 [Vulpes lagopus]